MGCTGPRPTDQRTTAHQRNIRDCGCAGDVSRQRLDDVDKTITFIGLGPSAVIGARVEDVIDAGADFSAATGTRTKADILYVCLSGVPKAPEIDHLLPISEPLSGPCFSTFIR